MAVTDIDEQVAALTAAGIGTAEPDRTSDTETVMITDLDGNSIAFVSPKGNSIAFVSPKEG